MDSPKDPQQPAGSGAAADSGDRARISAVNRAMVRGAGWMVAMRLVIRSIGLVSTVILARLLVPADFGLVAMATMIYGLIEIMGEFGFEIVLIQKQDAGRDWYDTAWTMSILRGLVIALVLIGVAVPAAGFFDEPRLAPILYVLAGSAVIAGFANIGTVEFLKQMTFGRDFRFMVSQKLVSFTVTMALAFILRSYWALVIGMVSSMVAKVVFSYAMHPYRPRLSLARWRDIMEFSKWLLANNVLGFLLTRGDTFFISKLVGAHGLGLYAVAHEISNMPTSELIAPIRRAIFPGYARLADDRPALRESFIAGWALILSLGVPMALGIWLVGDPLVRVFLGPKWLDAIPLIQVLAIYGLMTTFSTNSGPVYLALGKPKILTCLMAGGAVVLFPLLYWGTSQAGAYGAAWALVTTWTVWVVADLSIISRLLNIRARQFLSAGWRTGFAAAFMVIAVLGIQGWVRVTDAGFFELVYELALSILIGAAAYAGSHLLAWQLAGRPDGPECGILSALNFGAR